MTLLLDTIIPNGLNQAGVCSPGFSGSWGIDLSSEKKLYIHYLQRGSCWLIPFRGSPIKLEAGDIALATGNVGHALAHSSNAHLKTLSETPTFGIDEASTSILCGHFSRQDHDPIPLLNSLPELIHIKANQVEGDREIKPMINLLKGVASGNGFGQQALASRLVEALFVYILRIWQDNESRRTGQRKELVSDVQIAKALLLIHEHYDDTWTVDSLASHSSMSRAAFSKRFSRIVGEPPLTYLTKWRINTATRILANKSLTLGDIAQKVGYESEYSFSKAFKRLKGVSPGRFRLAAN